MPTRRRVAALAAAALMVAALLGACQGSGERHGAAAPAGATPGGATPPAPSVAPSVAPALLAAGRSQPVADPVYPQLGSPVIDVLHYGLALDWSPEHRELSGTATLVIRMARASSEIRLDLADPLRVDQVTVDGATATATRRPGDVVVAVGRRLARDTQVTVLVRYHGNPRPVPMPSTRPDADTIGFTPTADGSAWTMQEPYGAFTWYPANDQPSDEATYDVTVSVPLGWVGVSNGTLAGQTGEGDRTAYTWHSADPLATYLVTLAIGQFERHNAAGPHGIPVTTWVRKADEEQVLPKFEKIPAMLRWLEQRFGAYPFPSAGAVAVPSESGMETQTMVTIGPGFTDGDMLHELAHQWFGDSVTPRTWRDVWLNEGFAMYAQMMWEAQTERTGEAPILGRWRELDGELRAEHGPPGRYLPGHFAAANVYYCPALMLHEIRGRLGDARFFAMLRDWAQQHRNTTQDRASFTAWVNRYTGQNLTPLINRWLDSPTSPAAG
jgi:aminopeptidase N